MEIMLSYIELIIKVIELIILMKTLTGESNSLKK